MNVAALAVATGNDGLVIVCLNYRCTLPTPATEMLAIQAGTWKAFFMVRDAIGQQGIVLSPNAVRPMRGFIWSAFGTPVVRQRKFDST